MRIVVVGATGHVGGYLIPGLVADGHDVVAVSRGRADPYRDDAAWSRVERHVMDREMEDAAGTLAERLLALEPDVVVDMVCFTEDSARRLVEGLRGKVSQLVHIGTIWTHGRLVAVPAREEDPRTPWGEYGTQKSLIEDLLLGESRSGGLPVAIVQPGHITGPGWRIVNPQGTLDVSVWRALALGEPVVLPGMGLETVHHVHAADVAQLIRRCIAEPARANGEGFFAVSDRALSIRGFAESAARWFGREAELTFLPMGDFLASLAAEYRDAAYQHVARSHSMSIDKGRRLLGYAPQHTSLEAVAEAVRWLRADGRLGSGIPEMVE